jgi:hypothetical protein
MQAWPGSVAGAAVRAYRRAGAARDLALTAGACAPAQDEPQTRLTGSIGAEEPPADEDPPKTYEKLARTCAP